MRLSRLIAMSAAAAALCFGGISINAQAAPKTMPDGTLFDAEYYAQSNPDVVAALGSSPDMMYLHYVKFGKAEGRRPVAPGTDTASNNDEAPDFDAVYYAQKYPDVVSVLGKDPAILKLHYVKFGQKEGRFANKDQELSAARAASRIYDNNANSNTDGFNVRAVDLTNLTDTNAEAYAKKVLELTNNERTSRGIAPLVWGDGLTNAVNIRSKEIAQSFSHTRPDGTSFYTVLDSGPNYHYGENIAAGYSTPEAAMNGWMNSEGHRNNILNSKYTKMAVGYYYDGSTAYKTYWVQIFYCP
ncbi:MAG: hypothetical protein IKI75_13345 [Lachnospiraceae bacterium]|nr:hypothetical protein [Lachnospiraceae bacterium]